MIKLRDDAGKTEKAGAFRGLPVLKEPDVNHTVCEQFMEKGLQTTFKPSTGMKNVL